jgi:glycosyltransferase 2 family protein
LPDTPSSADTNHLVFNKDQRSKNNRPHWIIPLSFGIAALLLYFTLRDIDWQAFWSVIRFGHYEFLLLIIPIGCINYFIRAVRWGVLLQAEKKISIALVFWANMVGYMGNAYLPARAGEILRSAFLGRHKGLGTSFVLATALAERLLDVIALVLIGSISFLVRGNVPPILANALRFMAMVGFVGLAIMVAAPFHEEYILRVFSWLPLPEKYSGPVSQQITRFLTGMRSLRSIRRFGIFTILTAIIWFVDAFANTVGVRILSQTITIDQALILLTTLGLSSAIPSTPGYIGVYQFVAVVVLTSFGFSRATALAYILISQVINYLLVSFWGLIGFWRINKSNLHPSAVEVLKE